MPAPTAPTRPAAEPANDLLTPDFMRQLDRLDVLSRKMLQGKLQGERRSKRRGRSVEFADYRNYVPGDDPRFIDWNLYARLDKLFIRLFMAEEDLSVWVLLDTSASMDWPPEDSYTGGTGGSRDRDILPNESPDNVAASLPVINKLDYAKRVAAAIGYIGLVNYNRVHIHAFSSTMHAGLSNLRGRRPMPRLLNFIAQQRPPGDRAAESDLTTVMRRFALTQRGKGVVIVISDLLDRGDPAEAMRYLLGDRYDAFVLHLLSPGELEPNSVGVLGDLRLRDVEDAQTADVSVTPALLKRYKARLEEWSDNWRAECLRRGVAYMRANTATPFETLVLKWLRERGVVG